MLLGPTFYLRHIIRADRWRFLHRFVLVFYLLSFWHALLLGLDISTYGWVRPFMWLAQIPPLALFIVRLLEPRQKRRTLSPMRQALNELVRYGLASISGVRIVAILMLVLTGHSGFIQTI